MLKIRIWSFRDILYFLIFLSLLMSFLYRVFLIFFFFNFFFFTFFWLDQRPTLIGESDHFLIKGFILFFRWRACKYSFDFNSLPALVLISTCFAKRSLLFVTQASTSYSINNICDNMIRLFTLLSGAK